MAFVGSHTQVHRTPKTRVSGWRAAGRTMTGCGATSGLFPLCESLCDHLPLLHPTPSVMTSFAVTKASCDRAACQRIGYPSFYQAGNFRLTLSRIASITSWRMPLPQPGASDNIKMVSAGNDISGASCSWPPKEARLAH